MARPSSGISEKYIGVRIPESYYQSLVDEADNSGRTLAEVVREYLGAFVIPDIAEIELPVKDYAGAKSALDQLRGFDNRLSTLRKMYQTNLASVDKALDNLRGAIKKIEEYAEIERDKIIK